MDLVQVMTNTREPSSLACLVPIYKERPSKYECLSFLQNIKKTKGIGRLVLIHPSAPFDKSWYINFAPHAELLEINRKYFASQFAYNALFYEKWFYGELGKFKHVLIMQLDALILNPVLIYNWLNSPFSYVGAPEHTTYTYDVSGAYELQRLGSALMPISLQGLNGGLSLRVVDNMLALLREFPLLSQACSERRIGEDIFFCLLSRLTQQEIFFPNETLASKFAVACNFRNWIRFNQSELPFGVHRWFQNPDDANYMLNFLKDGTA